MATENLAGDLAGDIPAENRRWTENKVYTRRTHHNKTLQPASEREPIAIDLNSSPLLPLPVTSPPPPPLSSDEVPKNENAGVKPNQTIKINLRHRSKSELRSLRRILSAELDQVCAMSQRIDQFLGTDNAVECVMNLQHSIGNVESDKNDDHDPSQNTMAVEQNTKEVELAVIDKEMIPVADNKTELYQHPFLERNYDWAFQSCKALLTKLMRHKFGWVFNSPVDVKGLELYDYHQIIREPMDLGTVKSRLALNYYRTPAEFAAEVRLTFRNAMSYNPKGQDVHFMAQQLLEIFETRWPAIEAEYSYVPPPPLAHPPTAMEAKREVACLPIAMEVKREPKREPKPKPRPAYHSAAHIRRKKRRAVEKPKAKDLHKRDMTMEEKQKLRNNLEKLPQEKLEGLVEIIRKRSIGLNQKDDELEVDIECMDAETLWELDRYVTNYKKSLSKYKRKAELAALAKAEAEQRRELERAEPLVVGQTVMDRTVAAARPAYEASKVEARMENPTRSSSSRSSISDSGSSSSDSDSDSSSSNGSNGACSSKT